MSRTSTSELRSMPVGKAIQYKLPVISRADQLKGKKLATIRLPQGVSFKKQAPRLMLHAPTDGDGLLNYLVKNRSVVDCRSKVQTIESGFSWHLESTTQEYTLPVKALPFLDYQRIFEELEQYKNEKTLYNLTLIKDCLQDILAVSGWYSLIIPGAHIAFDSMEKLPLFTDFANLTQGFVEAEKLLQEERIFTSMDLPYSTQLIPLAAICACLIEGNQIKVTNIKNKIKQWYY